MTDIYEQHKAAFANVSAHVVLKDGKRVATVAFKYPRDGAGRLYAYVHWFGLQMTRGYAAGGGYDKHSAAAANAVAKLTRKEVDADPVLAEFYRSLCQDDGAYWYNRLEHAGFTVLQAV